jgi:hypothetical protein
MTESDDVTFLTAARDIRQRRRYGAALTAFIVQLRRNKARAKFMSAYHKGYATLGPLSNPIILVDAH